MRFSRRLGTRTGTGFSGGQAIPEALSEKKEIRVPRFSVLRFFGENVSHRPRGLTQFKAHLGTLINGDAACGWRDRKLVLWNGFTVEFGEFFFCPPRLVCLLFSLSPARMCRRRSRGGMVICFN